MLESYGRSLDDPEHALFHLYEIRDAARTHFNGDDVRRRRLAIPRTDWSDLGRLANDEPPIEGRHRGRHSALRNATQGELAAAREVARIIIEAFAQRP
jgi:hypothetical protein